MFVLSGKILVEASMPLSLLSDLSLTTSSSSSSRDNEWIWDRVDHWLGRDNDAVFDVDESNHDMEDVDVADDDDAWNRPGNYPRRRSSGRLCDDLNLYGWIPNNVSSSSSSSSCVAHEDSRKRVKQTGTTIVGIVSSDGRKCVLAADTRATESALLVADKRVCKIHKLTSQVYACGAGTSGDIDALLRKIHYSHLLQPPPLLLTGTGTQEEESHLANIVSSIRHELYKYSHSKDPLGVNLIVAGLSSSNDKFQLVAIHPHGSIDVSLPFLALGSGSLPAMSVLESTSEFETLEHLKASAIRAVKAGMENDLASGNSIHILTMEFQSPQSNNNNHNHLIYSLQHIVPNDDNHPTTPPPRNHHHPQSSSSSSSTAFTTCQGVNGFGSLPTPIIRNQKMILQDKQIIQNILSNWFRQKLNPN